MLLKYITIFRILIRYYTTSIISSSKEKNYYKFLKEPSLPSIKIIDREILGRSTNI